LFALRAPAFALFIQEFLADGAVPAGAAVSWAPPLMLTWLP
jgi:hypothetical protein